MGIKSKDLLDDELSRYDGRGCDIGHALRQDGEALVTSLLEAQLPCLYKLSSLQ